MSDFSSKSVLIVDNGLFVDCAPLLAKFFGKVQLYCPWENAYPKSTSLRVGHGLENVEKVDSLWPHAMTADLVVFPDLYFGGLQDHLRSLGRRVWGSGMGEDLELFRDFSKQTAKDLGVAVGKYEVVTGIKALRAALKKRSNVFVKVSRTRGDMETFRVDSLALAEPRLDELAHKLGAWQEGIDFIIEDAIEPAVEVGYDGFTIDGDFPEAALCGIEIKDKGYVGIFQPYKEMPEQIREINQKFSPVLKDYTYRNFWCPEARITKDGTPWVIDPCARWSSPCSELMMMMYTNLAEIFWHGAAGEVVTPKPAGKWGAEVMLVSSWANQNWQAVDFPEEIREHVKLHFPVVIDGRYYCTPQGFDLPAIGAVVAVGDTMEEAVAQVRKVAEQVKGYYIEADLSCFDEAEKEIAALKKFGIEL